MLKSIISTKSDIKNVLNTVLIDETGNKKILSSGKINPDGSIEVAKNFTSIDGTTTDYIYKDAAGSRRRAAGADESAGRYGCRKGIYMP